MPKNDLSFLKIPETVMKAARRFWSVLTNRFWLKLLSFLLAILLWNYVVSNNKTLTRSKTVAGIEGFVSGQSTLSEYGLALSDYPEEDIGEFTVRIEVAQSEYSRVKPENIQVMLDLSGVRVAGTQEVPFRATSAYGRVTEIIPSSITLDVEALDSRSVPVSVRLVNEQGDYWYSVTRTNPASLTISGASSVVRRITQARIESDVTGELSPYVRAESYVLLDSEGNEIPQSALTRTASSVTVMTDVYPKREIPISKEIENVISGRAADGYRITGITLQPESLTVAADGELLSGLSELHIEPVSVEGHTQSFTARAKLSRLSDFKYISSEEVYVNVTIEEISEKDNAQIQQEDSAK